MNTYVYLHRSSCCVAKDEGFMISALAYIEETLLCAEVVRLLPKFMAP
jgi:hypothetical protein